MEERTLLEAMHRRPAREPDGRDGRDRFSAAAVTHAADALPVNDILRGVSRTEQELLRLVLLVPESHDVVLDGVGPDRLPSQVARELYPRVVLARARDDHGVRPPYSLSAILDGLDDESRALGQALVSRPGPNPRELGDRSLAYEIERLIARARRRRVAGAERLQPRRHRRGRARRRSRIDRPPARSSAASSTSSAGRSTGAATRPDSSPARRWPPDEPSHRPSPSLRPIHHGGPADMADPLDKQLVEAVLASRARAAPGASWRRRSSPRCARAAPMARPPPRSPRTRTTTSTLDDEDFDLSADEDAEPERRRALVEIVAEEAVEGRSKCAAGLDAPAKLDRRRGRRADAPRSSRRCPRT